MKKFLIIFAMILTSEAMAVCSSPIARTNFSNLQVLTSIRLNTELNTVYTRTNELPGDCITDSTVTSSKILDGTIVNADISASAAIANSKLAANYTISSLDSGSFSTFSLTPVDVTNLTVSITTSGKPVEISLINKTNTDDCTLNVGASAGTASATMSALRNTVPVVFASFGTTAVSSNPVSLTLPPGAVVLTDFPAAGTYAYKLQVQLVSGTGVSFLKCRLLVKEY